MRVAVLSDTHGNLAALGAVMADARLQGASTFWNLGDAVDYGPQPNETLTLLRKNASFHLAGNHDLLLTGRLFLDDFSALAQDCYHWSKERVSPLHQEWLKALEPAGIPFPGVEAYHGSPADPAWGYLDTKAQAQAALGQRPLARLILVGHAHRQGAWRERADVEQLDPHRVREFQFKPNQPFPLEQHRWVLNVGSTGFPANHRDRDKRAGYLLLDLQRGQAELRRVDYDRQLTLAAYDGSGLPPQLRKML